MTAMERDALRSKLAHLDIAKPMGENDPTYQPLVGGHSNRSGQHAKLPAAVATAIRRWRATNPPRRLPCTGPKETVELRRGHGGDGGRPVSAPGFEPRERTLLLVKAKMLHLGAYEVSDDARHDRQERTIGHRGNAPDMSLVLTDELQV